MQAGKRVLKRRTQHNEYAQQPIQHIRAGGHAVGLPQLGGQQRNGDIRQQGLKRLCVQSGKLDGEVLLRFFIAQPPCAYYG